MFFPKQVGSKDKRNLHVFTQVQKPPNLRQMRSKSKRNHDVSDSWVRKHEKYSWEITQLGSENKRNHHVFRELGQKT